MKLTRRDLNGFLARPSASYRAALFFGPDEGQVSLYRKQAIAGLLTNPGDTMATTLLGGDRAAQDPSLLFESLAALSLLGEAPITVLDGASDKNTASIKEALCLPECQNFLLVVAGDLPARSTLRLLFEKEKNAASFACYRDEGEGLLRFVESSLRERGIRAERDALHYLTSQLGNDRAVTLQEIEKISLFLGENKNLSLRDALLLVRGNDTFSLDDLCLAVAQGNFATALSLTEKLLLEGENAITLLRSSARHFDRLRLAKQSMAEGSNAETAMNALRPPVFYKHKPAFGKQLATLSEQKITRALAALQQGESSIKHSKDARAYCLQAITISCRICA